MLRYPRVLDEIILRLLRKDPRERYQTAHALATDLEAVQRGLELGRRNPSLAIGTRDVREHLAEPNFIGRDLELNELQTALEANLGRPCRCDRYRSGIRLRQIPFTG